ncbi:MAG: type I-U CRISPR-associated protein Cas8c [Bryobacterales bacterium]|nr:type I-U CRISPR-associated protein Cas8c [Bryobacteraceae bacterium]MDW8355154.1 type I-U CRISPR-associated protein Cas8c [Bryobacterales bacterium]
MTHASIPVDVFNPGQVFACLGFLEAADLLLRNAVGGFDWSKESEVRFEIRAEDSRNPFEVVLDFLATAELHRLAPEGYRDPDAREADSPIKKTEGSNSRANSAEEVPLCTVKTFPAPEADRLALPLRLERSGKRLDVSHWCDGSSRNSFKLYAGQQRSDEIARQMIEAIRKLRIKHGTRLASDPFGATVPVGGSSFKFDARKSWTSIDVGYSPDDQSHEVEASPVVEMLAAIGLEHARPEESGKREVSYGIWGVALPLVLARPALAGIPVCRPMRKFRFVLDLSGKNKVVKFSQEEAIA